MKIYHKNDVLSMAVGLALTTHLEQRLTRIVDMLADFGTFVECLSWPRFPTASLVGVPSNNGDRFVEYGA